MLRETLVAMCDAQLRGGAEMYDAPTVTKIGPVLTATFPVRRRCFVTYQPFAMTGRDVDHLIEQVITHAVADEHVDHIKWKLREHDPAPELLQRLQEHGFTVDETETVLAGRVKTSLRATRVLLTATPLNALSLSWHYAKLSS